MKKTIKFSKVAGYVINTQKSVAFLYTNKYFKKSYFKISSKLKYLEINLMKDTKDLYSENYRTLMQEFENDRKK